MRILSQLIKEFWLPLILSCAWVFYNVYGGEVADSWTLKKVVNVFGPTFFLLSWLVGQFFRVKKQTKIEDNFDVMEERFNELLNKLKTQTEEMIGHISGGSSFPYLQIGMIDHNTNSGSLMIFHSGDHPLYDIKARIVDLNKSLPSGTMTLATAFLNDTNIAIETLIPSHGVVVRPWTIEHDPKQSYNVFFTARNGSFTQLIRLEKIGGKWVAATQVLNKNIELLHEEIDVDYPRDSNGKVVWETAQPIV